MRAYDPSPPNIVAICAEIEASEHILALPENWDDRGSVAYSPETWRRATTFVRDSAARLWHDFHLAMPVPDFIPATDGRIDVEWTANGRELVVSVPADGDAPASAHVYQDGVISLEGWVNTAHPDNTWLLAWVAR